MLQSITDVLNQIDSIMYYPILLVLLSIAGIYFSVRTKFIQIRLFPEAWRVILEKPEDEGAVSSFQALMVSTASRVGTGNIIGVSTAICLGGPGAVFWMWVLAILGSASAFIETTLAQIFKRKEKDGVGCYGGPAYYIQDILHSRKMAIAFVVLLILTYGFGFNMLCSYNVQSTFQGYSFYDPTWTPVIIGMVLALTTFYCLIGGGKRLVRVTEVLVPFMGIIYVIVTLIVILLNANQIPTMFSMIFNDAFNFRAIGSGLAGSCLVYGIKRGLYSNEAGVGSAPNAAASADVSHPCKQGLVAVVSVAIDTLFLCTASAFLCLISGIAPNAELSGAPYVQAALEATMGSIGPIFITIALVLFAFTTLLGNLYYCEIGIKFLNHEKSPSKLFMIGFYVLASALIFVGAIAPSEICWALADIFMGGMTMINLPAIILLGRTAIKAGLDYERQYKEGKDPVFKANHIGLDDTNLDYWK